MKYTFIHQQDATDCAAACLAMVCLHYKKETTITALRDLMGTDLKGTNLLGLSKCAETLGFVSQAVRVDRQNFLTDFTLPCIANVITKEGMTHFVVVFRKTRHRNKDYVVIGDPAKDLMKITLDEFYETFTGVLLILKPDHTFVPGKTEKGKVFGRFVRLLLPHKKLFAFSILASMMITVLGIASSFFNKILMDEILPYRLKNTLTAVLIVFGSIAVASTAVSFVRQWMMVYLSQKIDIPLLLGYFRHIYRLPMKFFSTRKTGDILTRFSDAFTIKDIFTSIALTLLMDVSMALITGVILFRMNMGLFGIILFLTICSILLVLIFKQPYKKINEEQMQQTSVMNSQMIEGLRAVETIKGNANEDAELECIEREYIRSLRIGMKEQMLSGVQGAISSLISTGGNLLLMFFGIRQVIDGELTLGSMMAFTTMAGYFMDPVGRLVGLQLRIQEANISMKRLTEILDYEPEQTENEEHIELEAIDGDIDIRNVTFRYGSRQPVLQDVSFTIGKGQKVALVGESGSGKSTIAKLLLKYYEPESGEILVNGTDIEKYDNSSVRRSISYVPQTIELFSKTIYDNIRISKTDATAEEVKQAAKKAEAHAFIQKLPLQYKTYLQEAGNGLSGGEKQRIALARAFLKNSNFYILDESTSSLDFSTENLIFDLIYHKLQNKSMLIIAHRLATVRSCDLILVLDHGKIVEQGTHEELLAQQGKYYKLWNLQQGIVKAEPAAQNETVSISAAAEEDDSDTLVYS